MLLLIAQPATVTISRGFKVTASEPAETISPSKPAFEFLSHPPGKFNLTDMELEVSRNQGQNQSHE